MCLMVGELGDPQGDLADCSFPHVQVGWEPSAGDTKGAGRGNEPRHSGGTGHEAGLYMAPFYILSMAQVYILSMAHFILGQYTQGDVSG